MQSGDVIKLIQGHGFKGQGHRQHFKKCTFPAKASVLSIATKNVNLLKLQLLGDFVPIPVPGGCTLYPAGGITNHISRPSWLHQLYNTSRASGYIDVHCTITC